MKHTVKGKVMNIPCAWTGLPNKAFLSISFMFPSHCRLCTDDYISFQTLVELLKFDQIPDAWFAGPAKMSLISSSKNSFALYFHCPKVLQLENVACYLFSFSLELDWQFFLPDWKRRHQGIVLKPEDVFYSKALKYIASKNIAGAE